MYRNRLIFAYQYISIYFNVAVTCPAGTFQDNDECVSCPRGFYQPDERQVSCELCPVGTTTNQTGSTAVSNCTALDPGKSEFICNLYENVCNFNIFDGRFPYIIMTILIKNILYFLNHVITY